MSVSICSRLHRPYQDFVARLTSFVRQLDSLQSGTAGGQPHLSLTFAGVGVT
jgi:hypothetical protein